MIVYVKHRVVTATELRAKCYAMLREISEHGGTLTVTKRGRAVATISQPLKALRASRTPK
jgi:antitoxin (DNA-binding transcriptional repressor) of toxin-antitoxin stability system